MVLGKSSANLSPCDCRVSYWIVISSPTRSFTLSRAHAYVTRWLIQSPRTSAAFSPTLTLRVPRNLPVLLPYVSTRPSRWYTVNEESTASVTTRVNLSFSARYSFAPKGIKRRPSRQKGPFTPKSTGSALTSCADVFWHRLTWDNRVSCHPTPTMEATKRLPQTSDMLGWTPRPGGVQRFTTYEAPRS